MLLPGPPNPFHKLSIQKYFCLKSNPSLKIAYIIFSGFQLFAQIQPFKTKKGAPTGTPFTNH